MSEEADRCECGHAREDHGPPDGITINILDPCRYCSTCADFTPEEGGQE